MTAVAPTIGPVAAMDRRQDYPWVVVVDPRRYRHHRGYLLIADRLYVRGIWTPLVRVRARHPRAADGGTEW